jgi:hypothetical protein
MSRETKSAVAFAAFLWTILVVAATAWAYGDREASNAVVGCGVPVIVFTVLAWWMARQDRR